MTEIAVARSSEEHDARTSCRWPTAPRPPGFRSAWISDHYHPWIDRPADSPFVGTVVGATAATRT
jgi:hypothetical protein